MISKLLIQNFQKHKKILLDLKEITTVLGPTDSGKSSIIRSIRWMLLNHPSGTAFRRWGTASTQIKAKIDGRTVVRRRGKTENAYVVDGEKYVAFGSQPPEPVSRLARVSEGNFQSQHDAIYWFSLPPGQVAKQLNKIVNLEDIDKVLALIATRATRTRATVQVCADRCKTLHDQVKELQYVEQYTADLNKLTALSDEIDASRSAFASDARKIEHVSQLKLRADNARKAKADAGVILELIDKRAAAAKQLSDLTKQITQIRRLKQTRDRLDKAVTSLQTQLSKIKVCPTCHRPLP